MRARPPQRVEELILGFRDQFHGVEWEGPSPTVLVALSGGLDSLVLLHLLRFSQGLPEMELRAAHYDHAMRRGSPEDALWVSGFCKGWGIPCHQGVAEKVLGSEEEAREKRYEFLLNLKEELGAPWLLTAHHGDDQAETVLFRIFRGTGLGGLAGIPRLRYPGVFRPLLPFSRDLLEAYASFHRIRPRVDPSNEDLSFARNLLRHRILPQAEEGVAKGARGSLRRLARLARENEEAWGSLIPEMVRDLTREDDRGIVVVRSGLLTYHPAVRSRILRYLLRIRGVRLDEAGTRRLMEFTRTGASGRVLELPGGLRFFREFDTFLLDEAGTAEDETPVIIPDRREGKEDWLLGGRRLEVRWGEKLQEVPGEALRLDPDNLTFPLKLRGWIQGDRIALPHGGKKLKKLFLERGIPAGARKRYPVLVDALGRLLWVWPLARSTFVPETSGGASFLISIREVHGS